MSLQVLNDYAKIRLDEQDAFSAKAGDAATSGILVRLPETLTHVGMYSSIIESSFMTVGALENFLKHWQKYIGKRVFWLALAEKGAILQEQGGEKFAYIKLTSLMAWSEPDENAESVLDKHGGSFAA